MNILTVKKTALFKGMTDEEVNMALKVLGAHEKSFKKGEAIFLAGDTTCDMGMILEGSVTIESNDLWGNRAILNLVEAGDVFAEVYAALRDEPMMVDARANEDCRILFIRIGGLFRENTGEWQRIFMQNLLYFTCRKNLTLSGRVFHTSPKTIRGRIMAYLDTMSTKKHSREFDIPFDRQQLADYLNVDRTALSKELGRMKNEGLIDFSRSHFCIL